jgi:hypothetical protein
MGWHDIFSWGEALGMLFFFLMADCFALGLVNPAATLALAVEVVSTYLVFIRYAITVITDAGVLGGPCGVFYHLFKLCFEQFCIAFPSVAACLKDTSTLVGFLGDVCGSFKTLDTTVVLLVRGLITTDVMRLLGLIFYIADSLGVVFEVFYSFFTALVGMLTRVLFFFNPGLEILLGSVENATLWDLLKILWPTWGQVLHPGYPMFRPSFIDACTEAIDSVIDPYVGPQLDHLIARMDLWAVLFILPLMDELEDLL